MHIFKKEYRKNVKNKLVNYLYSLYLRNKDDRYSDDLIVFTIKALHLVHPLNCLVVMFFAPKIISITTFFSVVLVLIMFIYLDGCFLSSLEYKINKLDVTIADPMIMLFKDDITTENRIFYSITTIIIYLIFSLLILYFRFYAS